MRFGVEDIDKDKMEGFSTGFLIQIDFIEENQEIEEMINESNKLSYQPTFNDY